MQNKLDLVDKKYLTILEEAKQKIVSSRINLTRIITREQFSLYWWIGQKISDAQAEHGWGRSVVEQLAKDLRHAFPDVTHGFSSRNLWDMRRIYIEYKDHPNLRQLVAEIPWGQNLVILNKIKEISIRQYYLEMTHQHGWTRNTLLLQINSQAYERHITSHKQNNFIRVLPSDLAKQAHQSMKDVYMLDTLGLTAPVLELEIENRMVSKIKTVMLELGYGFSFIGNQYRIIAEGNEYFIDLLFYNRRLQALVALELKKGAFQPEYAGKMNFYLNLLDDFVREPHENPSIGIILCSERNRFEVEYALRGINKPVGVSEFRLSKTLPAELTNKLPNPEELEKEILRELGDDENIEV
jgi:predicted nuclease of restriction endonuclease-like (RecB) superfamily